MPGSPADPVELRTLCDCCTCGPKNVLISCDKPVTGHHCPLKSADGMRHDRGRTWGREHCRLQIANIDFVVRQLGGLISLYAHAIDHNLSVMPWLSAQSLSPYDSTLSIVKID